MLGLGLPCLWVAVALASSPMVLSSGDAKCQEGCAVLAAPWESSSQGAAAARTF